MSDEEMAAFLPRVEEAYVRQLVDSAGMSEEEARTKAAHDYASLFPDGRVRDEHFVFVVEDGGGRAVGHVVYAVRPPGSRNAWLYKLEIDAASRGRGYGREAMRLFEQDAAARGLTSVGLNVFGGNKAARSLYRSLGYREVAVDMTKHLDEPK
jgi:ribosomal protein S18 acetylase RimI-like enzyme